MQGAEDPMAAETSLFEGEDLRVVAAPQADPRLLVVSFTGRDLKPPAAVGAGAGFLAKHALDAVHVISKKNHWWNTAEWAAALGTIADYAARRRTREIVTYGSSMGGHGALVASKPLRAARVVAYAPQFSVDPQLVPWETRWRSDTGKIAFVGPAFAEAVAAEAIYVFSDPFFLPDQRHVEAIARHAPLRHLRVTFSEHDVSRVLSDCGLISEVTLKALRGTLTERDFTRSYRARRGRTALAYGGAARLLHERRRSRAALAFARHGYAMLTGAPSRRTNPEFDRFVLGYLGLLVDVSEPQEALAVIARWSEGGHGSLFAFERLRAQALQLSGRTAEALEAVERAMADRPTERVTQALAAEILKRLGDGERAMAFLRRYEAEILRVPGSVLAFGSLMRDLGHRDLGADLLRRGLERFPAYDRLRRAVDALA